MNKERHIRNMRIKKGIYVLPNLFTTASLFMGFYSIIASVQEKFFLAAIAIIISLIFDGLDGRIARMTNTTSKFGAEYDSLADLIAFGVAPALLAYTWAMSFDGKPGWMAGFLFVACGALRLARFNIQIGLIDSKYFNGLPIPAAACVIATTVIFFDHIGFEGTLRDPFKMIMILVVILALLMVSNIKYYSFKNMNFRSRMPFKILLVAIGIFLVFYYKPEIMAFVIMVGYALSGPVWWVLKFIQKMRQKDLTSDEPKQES
ncbi:MAG: CDP-diacylglycerol--serine O-phosphatidyltransferase [Deltaproteobacteria bacterium HGW-Deltaproteobacteria-7]|jgi:CDP-diacylglycerol--serine O-phosphatidyltransferase|nr:MAG: CDP-diacylglycerol--serine O-phosphatidyltransferase [Deltaproteobacteria bacterium HGW-Deltaproteobacteria-7]PKN20939.1 MAG: CDP-diacylglycerol--serine O-phosphatidyltransferase [Deltaproteobacteria bacterium HGW-Deltaproteobacteria-6]